MNGAVFLTREKVLEIFVLDQLLITFVRNLGAIISLSCENRGVDDCKMLNFEEYCYCTKDLCNSVSYLPDDEDYEGSGLVPVTSTTNPPKLTITNASQAKKQYSYLTLMLLTFIYL